MSELTYTGPSSTLFLSKDKSRPLVTGQTYSDLDENQPQVKNLIARKMLIPADPSKATETASDDQSDTKAKPTRTAQRDSTKGKSS